MTQTSRFRDLHTRTHEVELLISGALVFGLIQAPSQLDAAFQWWVVRLDGLAMPAATYIFMYAEMLAYSLLGTFILHLCMRGYWVALLGLESVWPTGWDWDKLKFGPYSRPVAQRQVDSLSGTIDRADDRASVVFAAGALLVLIFLYSLLLILSAVAAGAGLAALTGWRISGPAAFFTLLGVLVTLSAGAPLIDRRFGSRISPTSRTGRTLNRLVTATMWISAVRWTGALQFVFQTHLGERRVAVALALSASVLASVMISTMVWRSGTVRIDGWRYFSEAPGAVLFDPLHYRSSGTATGGVRPTIDADIITGPYLKLYLPYRPRRLNPMIEQRCAAVAASPSNAGAASCIGGLHTVSLDGAVLGSLTWDFTRDIPSQYVGVMTYLDVRTLAAGRHELVIESPTRDGVVTTRIPFYRE